MRLKYVHNEQYEITTVKYNITQNMSDKDNVEEKLPIDCIV